MKNTFKIKPNRLKHGDRIRFVSPASKPEENEVEKCRLLFESWGLQVEYGKHIFDSIGYLAGKDEDRLNDFNDALSDPDVKGIFATRGGKGAYRIANSLDFESARKYPKIVCGFSDITVIQLSLLNNSELVGIHGPMVSWRDEHIGKESVAMLKSAIMTTEPITIKSELGNITGDLTTKGKVQGAIIGGNLDSIATCVGWALPKLDSSILLLEGVNVGLGHIDRQLTMMINSGSLNGIKGVAIGRFTDCGNSNGWTAVDVLRNRLGKLKVPVLGGLPIGHDKNPHTLPIGAMAIIDCENRILKVESGVN